MKRTFLLTIAVFISSHLTFVELNSAQGPKSEPSVLDYCLADSFNASCLQGQVLLMTAARFGRMRKGRCVKGDYGLLGCSADALADMDSLCSGLRDCRFRIFDSSLRLKSACPEDMASYLEASYRCIDVADRVGGQCGGQKQVRLTQPTGYLASVVSQDYGLGTIECPWAVRAFPGQTVDFHLRYFGAPAAAAGVVEAEGPRGEITCHDLLTFREPGTGHLTVSTCDGVPKTEREVFRSRTNEVLVQMVGRMQLRILGRFIVRYQVTGCPNIPQPLNATVRRDGDKITVKCNFSDHTWYLVCKNSSWLGETVNCNHVGEAAAWNIGHIFDSSFPFGILLVVAIGVALGIFCGGLLLTCVVVYMKRQRRLRQTMMDECTDFRNFDVYDRHATTTAEPEVEHSQTIKVVHPLPQGSSSSGVSSLDHVTEYDGQFVSVRPCTGDKAMTAYCYPSLVSKNHLYESPHVI